MKKFTVLAIVAAMLLLCTACNKNDDVSASSADSSSSVSSLVESENVSSTVEESSEVESIQLEDEVGSTPEYEDVYDSEKVEIIGNDVVKTSVAGEITQIMRFTFNDDKTSVARVRLEFYTTNELNFDEEVDLYKELGYTIVEVDKTHLIMDANDESIEAWSNQATTMDELAELLKA